MKVGIVGLGHLGMTISEYLVESHLNHEFYVYNRNSEKAERFCEKYPKVRIMTNVISLVESVDIVLSFVIKEAQKGIASVCEEHKKYYVSASSGLSLEEIAEWNQYKVSRIMPTIVKDGYTLICHSSTIDDSEKNILDNLFSAFTTVKEIDEDKMIPYTILTSCGPGIIAGVIDEIASAMSSELQDDEISHILTKTIKATIEHMEMNNLSPKSLKEQVATPGGLTDKTMNIIRPKVRSILTQTGKMQ